MPGPVILLFSILPHGSLGALVAPWKRLPNPKARTPLRVFFPMATLFRLYKPFSLKPMSLESPSKKTIGGFLADGNSGALEAPWNCLPERPDSNKAIDNFLASGGLLGHGDPACKSLRQPKQETQQ